MDRYKKLLEFIQELADEQADARWRDRIESLEERLAAMGANEQQWRDRLYQAVEAAGTVKRVTREVEGVSMALVIKRVVHAPDGIEIEVY